MEAVEPNALHHGRGYFIGVRSSNFTLGKKEGCKLFRWHFLDLNLKAALSTDMVAWPHSRRIILEPTRIRVEERCCVSDPRLLSIP
jgi:hypothetical protein